MRRFFLEGPATFSLPDSNYASKVFLNRPVREACQLYNSTTGIQRKLAASTFYRYRPEKKVKLQKDIPLNSCLCEVCENFKLKCKALTACGVKNVVRSAPDAVSITICAYKHLTDHPDPSVSIIGRYGYCKCIFRKCDKCGVSKMKEHLEIANEQMLRENKNVHWCVWENVEKLMKKGDKVNIVNRVEKLSKSGSLQELVDCYLKDLEALSTHLFLSRNQYQQAINLRDTLPKGVLLCSHDFCTNFTCHRQNEIGAAHYDHSLATVHASVAYFRCETPGCQKVVRMEIIHLSKILKHNASAFNQFNINTVKIAEAETKTNFKLVVNVTDQAPSQYKNRNSFLFSSMFKKPLIHFFLGSRHGKFWSDAASGRFVQWLRKEIAADIVEVTCAKDIAKHATKKYATPELGVNDQCQHFRVKINLVDRIPRNLKDSVRIENTREIHMLKNTGKNGFILTRNIGCLCLPCISGEGECKYPEYFQDWSEHRVIKRRSLELGKTLWPINLNSSCETANASVMIGHESRDVFSESHCEFDFEVEDTTLGDQPEDSVTSPPEQQNTTLGDQPHDSMTSPPEQQNTTLGDQPHDSVTSPPEQQRYQNDEGQKSPNLINSNPILYGKVKSWTDVLASMKKVQSYTELQILCNNLSLPPLSLDLKEKYDPGLDDIDTLTLDVIKSAEISIPQFFKPTSIIADGNCFPRSLSRLLFGTQCRHGELRVRLVKEGVMNEKHYLDNAHLKVGVCEEIQDSNFVETYCKLSDEFDTSRTLTKRNVLRIYQNEWFQYRLLGTFSGIFQMLAAANVSQTRVKSYFPDHTVDFVFMNFHRSMVPFGRTSEDLKTCHVVWTKSRSAACRLQHFVPLLLTEE